MLYNSNVALVVLATYAYVVLKSRSNNTPQQALTKNHTIMSNLLWKQRNILWYVFESSLIDSLSSWVTCTGADCRASHSLMRKNSPLPRARSRGAHRSTPNRTVFSWSTCRPGLFIPSHGLMVMMCIVGSWSLRRERVNHRAFWRCLGGLSSEILLEKLLLSTRCSVPVRSFDNDWRFTVVVDLSSISFIGSSDCFFFVARHCYCSDTFDYQARAWA
jgi:hypothetical protein